MTGNVEKAIPLLSSPMELDGEAVAPAQVRRGRTTGGVSQLSVTIRQGKNRQVRRMCAQAGLTVLRLKRVREGALPLDRSLRPGQWRPLTPEELAALRGAGGAGRMRGIFAGGTENPAKISCLFRENRV